MFYFTHLALGATPCTPKTNDDLPCQFTCGSATYDFTSLKLGVLEQDITVTDSGGHKYFLRPCATARQRSMARTRSAG